MRNEDLEALAKEFGGRLETPPAGRKTANLADIEPEPPKQKQQGYSVEDLAQQPPPDPSVTIELRYALQNNTDNDVTLPTDSLIMSELKNHSILQQIDLPTTIGSSFIPARQRSMITVSLSLSGHCPPTKDPKVCFEEFFSGVAGLVLFDSTRRYQIELPLPKP